MLRVGCLTIFAIFGAILCQSPSAEGLGTVYDIDLNKYVGVWYNAYTNYWSDSIAGTEGAECVTSTYGKISDVNLTVHNAYNIRDGGSSTSQGFAWIPDVKEPGKLLVSLDGGTVSGTYWIVKLGPLVNDQYEYSVVSNDEALEKPALFVLARHPATFYELYDTEVREYLLVTGFTTPTTQPVKVYHGDDCEYL